VALKGHGVAVFFCTGSFWNKHKRLCLSVRPYTPQAIKEEDDQCEELVDLADLLDYVPPDDKLDADAADCFLLSDWPVVCGCWIPS
jgi:hypothetical protein